MTFISLNLVHKVLSFTPTIIPKHFGVNLGSLQNFFIAPQKTVRILYNF